MATETKTPALTQEELDAIHRVLSMAENSPVWSRPIPPDLKAHMDANYTAIQEVRAFLKRNGVLTLFELTQRMSKGGENERAND
jgi:hypothetical protein